MENEHTGAGGGEAGVGNGGDVLDDDLRGLALSYGHKPFLKEGELPDVMVLQRGVDEPFKRACAARAAVIRSLVAGHHKDSVGEGDKLVGHHAPASPAKSVLSDLLMEYIGNISTDPHNTEHFLCTFDRVISGEHPSFIHLSHFERAHYSKIAEMCRRFCEASTTTTATATAMSSTLTTSTTSTTSTPDAVRTRLQNKAVLREKLIRFWLGLGGMLQTLQAVNFLLGDCN